MSSAAVVVPSISPVPVPAPASDPAMSTPHGGSKVPSDGAPSDPGSLDIPVARWPGAAAATTPAEASAAAGAVVGAFNAALARRDFAAVAELFVPGDDGGDGYGYWRDHLAASWDLHTARGRDGVAAFLRRLEAAGGKAGGIHLEYVALDTGSPLTAPRPAAFDANGTSSGIAANLTLKTRLGSGKGLLRLAAVPGGKDEGTAPTWKIWTLYTALDALDGFEEPRGARRPLGVQHGGQAGRKNWVERRKEEAEFADGDPDVLIIGAGQAGLTAHARLKMLGVRALTVDKNSRVGDNWRRRYKQLVLHDSVWYDHMPYLPFPDWWPVFTPKDKLADFLESYARLLELDVWTETTVEETPVWDPAAERWEVTVVRSVANSSGARTTQKRTLRPRHVVQATGHAGKPRLPTDIPGLDSFAGAGGLFHSSQFPGADPDPFVGEGESRRRKRAVVVGACNSSHDICQDYAEAGWEVTMVQRSSTCVVSSEATVAILLGETYSERGPPTEIADLAFWSQPWEVTKAAHVDATAAQQAMDRDLLDGLAKAGFNLDRGPMNAGLLLKYFQRGGGYYIDVGASALIASGAIGLRQGAGKQIAEVLPRGLRFADGEVVDGVDQVVFATGYGNMRDITRQLMGDAVADRVADVWGLDHAGEVRAMWRPGGGKGEEEGQKGFWFHGGNLAVCRYFSRILALQIKARLEGLI